MNQASIRVCKICAFLFSLCTNLLAPLLLAIRAELALSLRDSGLLFFVFYAGNFAACAVSGRLMSLCGKQRVLRVYMSIMALLCFLVAAAPNFPVLCVLLFGLGFTTLVNQVATCSIAPELAGDHAASAMTNIQAYCGLGACGGLLWSGLLATLQVSWRTSYLLFGFVGVCGALLTIITPFPALKSTDSGRARDLLRILKSPRLLPTFACLLLYAGAETSLCSWLVSYLAEERAFSTLAGAAVTGIIWLSLFVGRILCARLVRRYPVRRILTVLIPSSAVLVCLVPLLPSFGVWFGAVGIGLALSGCWPLIASRLLDDPAHDGATALSIAFLFSFFSNALMPYLIGAVANGTSLAFAILVDGGVLFLLFVVFVITGRTGRLKHQPTS